MSLAQRMSVRTTRYARTLPTTSKMATVPAVTTSVLNKGFKNTAWAKSPLSILFQ
ncbi:MAG: hypothetical protein BWY85_01566 [Firmicutes bacterium ADurb.Bin506]|nr:MAG: hypothetical protein BWY85_01566 [Firmicutes bacterium ADurb.Bin506]